MNKKISNDSIKILREHAKKLIAKSDKDREIAAKKIKKNRLK